MEIKKIGVVGAGIMGSGIAQVSAMSGFQVVVQDIKDECLELGRSKVESSLQRMVKKNKITDDKSRQVLNSIKWTTEIADLAGVELLIEAVPEVEELKKDVYRSTQELLAEGAIIASNTSTISISLLQSSVSDPSRFIGMHWFNPPVIMKLIEVIKGTATSDETVEHLLDVCRQMNKETIVCLDSQGFVVSRALLAFRAECYRIYEEGIASKEDIDKALRLALGHPMGQFELADFSGLDIEVNAYKGMAEIYGDRFRPSQRLLNLVRAGRLGRKSKHGWYDYE
ncbi:MAG: 3-hydroxybutyryl-CoA dehydrogenase [Deltaproteobacteria bacterium]|nr:MAG: 3-hydroxybutyryl-CoA dehydrogenase [Deltaproteobacteria bacterium]